MSIESERDQREVLKALGERVLIDGKEIWAIFENTYSVLDFDVESSEPMLTALAADLPKSTRGVAVDVQGALFTVANTQPDGTGFVVLRLVEA